jgi:CTP:molybdopterin cytidylyltransferase MocA
MIDHQNTIVVIPARMASTRLPGKPMADINGLPMIVHVWGRAVAANLGHVLVAAAETEIANAIRAAGGDAIVTEAKLASGSDRVAAALALRDRKQQFTHVVNLQGDLPSIDGLAMQRCLAGLTNPGVDISTIAAEIKDEGATTPMWSRPWRRWDRGGKSPSRATSCAACRHRRQHHGGTTSASMPISARRSSASSACRNRPAKRSVRLSRCGPSTMA